MRYTQDLRDGNFDRGYTYDHAGRLSEATSGREARGEAPTYPYPAERPYQQTFSYDAWNNLGRTGMLWSEGQSDLPSYTNNRRSDWAYDAEGNAIGGGWAPYRVHDYDAAGQHVNVYEKSWSGPSENQVFHQNTINQTYDGDGQPGKRIETRHSEDANNNVTNDVRTAYSLRSSVLGGVVIAEIDQYGQREGHVYVGGEKIADYNGWAPYGVMDFRHANPANGNWVNVHLPGNGSSRREFDPLGANVGTTDPFVSHASYNDMVGNDWLYQQLGNPFDLGSGCGTLDGMPISCSELNQRMESGTVAREYLFRAPERRDGPPRLRPPGEPPPPIVWHRETHTIRSLGLGLFTVDYPRWIEDNEAGQMGTGTAVLRFHHAPQQPADCHRFAFIVERIANEAANADEFMQRMVNRFIGPNLNVQSGLDFDRAAAIGNSEFRDSGFKPQFQDGSNQVRHFTGGLWAGYRYGPGFGQLGMNSNEDNTVTPGRGVAQSGVGILPTLWPTADSKADVALNSISVPLGVDLTPRKEAIVDWGDKGGWKKIPANPGYKGLAAAIRTRLCE